MKHLAHLNKYFWKYKWYLALGIVFTVISNLFGIMPAQMVRKSLDQVNLALHNHTNTSAEILSIVSRYGFWILAMAILKGIFLFAVRQTIIVMSRHIEFDLKNEIYEHYQTLPLSFYKKNNTGDLLARVSEDVGKVRMYVGPSIMYLLNMAVMVVLIVSYMFSVNARLTIWVLLPLPVLSFIIFRVSSKINKKSEQIQRSLSGLSTYVQEAFSGIRVLKTFVREADSLQKFEKESNNYRENSLVLTRFESFFSPTIAFLVGLSVVLCVYIGGQEVVAGHLTVGNITEFILYVTMLTWPMTALGWTSGQIQRAAASQQRINEFLKEKTDIVSLENLQRPINGSIHFENVSFQYPDTGIWALKNIDFSIEPGNTLAILGTTGSGKSTIAQLLLRMYDASSGRVCIDKTDIKAYDIQNLRAQMGYVAQETFLFSDTVLNNAMFGTPNMTTETAIEAMKNADLYSNVMDFPEKLQTMIGERGITLSGGQKQRLSITRAIARKPKILILDDCLSAVDTHTEAKILDNLQEVMKNRTCVVISHRVSSAKLADHIVMLDSGQIIEEGSHTELMAKKGAYFELYEKQLSTEEV